MARCESNSGAQLVPRQSFAQSAEECPCPPREKVRESNKDSNSLMRLAAMFNLLRPRHQIILDGCQLRLADARRRFTQHLHEMIDLAGFRWVADVLARNFTLCDRLALVVEDGKPGDS